MKSEYKGYSLFSDVTEELRFHNRGNILANFVEDFSEGGKMTAQGASMVLGYYAEIPLHERKATMGAFTAILGQRGLAYVN